jgi:hypothetical protein
MNIEELKRNLNYDQETGEFTWKVSNNNRIKIGERAGYISKKNGYRQIKVNKKLYMAHRLAWLYVYGELPKKEIDHIDHNRDNNSINNLREASRRENSRNTKIRSDNYSGVTGVFWNKNTFKWQVRIYDLNGMNKHVGFFEDFHEARIARRKAEREFGYHTNHGAK